MKGPIEYIKESWIVYTKKENFIFFAKIMAVLLILTSGIGFIYGYLYPSTDLSNPIDFSNIPMTAGFVVLTILSAIIGIWSGSVRYFAVLKTGADEKEIFKQGYKYMLRYFMISLVTGLIVGLGIVLLIIPGIMFGVWYSFAILLVLDKDMKIGQALKTSKEMVKGKFWKVLGRFSVFGLFSFFVSLVLGLIPYVGPLMVSFIAPLFTLPFYLLYRDLSVSY